MVIQTRPYAENQNRQYSVHLQSAPHVDRPRPAPASRSIYLFGNCCRSISRIVHNVFIAVAKFFYDRYTDLRLFMRSISSLSGRQERARLLVRSAELRGFADAVRRFNPERPYSRTQGTYSREERASFLNHYFDLLPTTRRSLFRVNPNLISRFAYCNHRPTQERIRAEILRECNQAVFLQNRLWETFRCCFRRASFTPALPPRPAFEPPRFLPPPVEINPLHEPALPVRLPGVGSSENVPVVVAETPPVLYDRNHIPQEIQETADRIAGLEERFVAHIQSLREEDRPEAPGELIFAEEIGDIQPGFYRIPVFDASHSNVQGANHPRHALDAGQMNFLVANAGSDRSFCFCGREYNFNRLEIDRALQLRVLQYLEANTPEADPSVIQAPEGPYVHNLQIPGTRPYLRGAIPLEIQMKALRIAALEERYQELLSSWDAQHPGQERPAFVVPECPISNNVLGVPVFDASHGDVAQAIRTAEAAEELQRGKGSILGVRAQQAAAAEARARLPERNLRHWLNHDYMNQIVDRANEAERDCYNRCGVRLNAEHLVIDEAFMDETIAALEAIFAANAQPGNDVQPLN